MMQNFQFDPRDLVAGPFRPCPKCQVPEFGVAMVSHNAYFRRCRACFHSAMFTLPALRKKVIYIDQFGISNLMKALDPRAKGHARASADPFWSKLFEALEIATKTQIIVCPDSDTHREESSVAPFYHRLKRIYEHFSNGVSFHDSRTIRRVQLVEMAEKWLKGDDPKCTLDAALVTRGQLHGWTSPIGVSVTLAPDDEVLREIRRTREQVHQEMQIAFEYWKSEKLSFDERFAKEGGGHGKKLLISATEWCEKVREAQFGLHPVDPREIHPPPAVEILTAIAAAFRRRGASDGHAMEKAVKFLGSEVPTGSPRRQIFGLLYAALAMRAQNGQAQAPNQGMANDISIISDLLPYCDAMFIDNGARALLNDIPKNRKLAYGASVFSPNTRDQFLAYLEKLAADASQELRETLREVYGDDYNKPYTEILASPS